MYFWQHQAGYGLEQQDIDILLDAKSYRTKLLELIANAKRRIYITALYLQDDEAGREILAALHTASRNNPDLEVKVLVDFHRAQRGLIGAAASEGNAALYLSALEQHQSNVQVYGVPVKAKELFGVLHLKGFVIDDTLLYSGASLNNVYLQYFDKYRLDRYFLVRQPQLCDAFVEFTESTLLASEAVPRLDTRPIPKFIDIKGAHRQLVKALKKASYALANNEDEGDLTVRPFIGLGRRNNKLNRLIKQLFDITEQELVLYTPYFNFPTPLLRALRRLLRQGKQITIVVGDKTANDFYIPPEEKFSKVGALPYLYETILAKFLKTQQRYVEAGNLNVYLWKHDNNSFHLKGICSDNRYHLLSGHNLNPRAWGLDIENGIFIDDKKGQISDAVAQEKAAIMAHCTRLQSYTELEQLGDYPEPVQKILGQAKRVKVDFIIKRFI
ncbi:CDP-diacylglycerol--serine O-phosphatidyltransferase [Pseudoalteromonas sp. BDTF-M6]|uniref:CDP-diacylglycerol--serine O-phosphatidyltransferase n=1 Tax=Pseudoalteromonas sp. BDTF-M6 TaxID=2796132 RepID=UPI001BAF8800|nr:CDP-diacylglycerol--serine O-phosphatidyltransferase [Pseudoalteromonas sp. BDTF-M6]MBS3796635.1 CDP-diacylglycerol--serine O-phosphatidyltransferase [Pseudoalteromonas sp. BDTF-M6]